MEQRNQYFDEALSDFVHDVASGGSIRHLVDLGYSFKQIMESLTYPEKPLKVQKTMMRHLLESKIIVYRLPEGNWEEQNISLTSITQITYELYRITRQKGEDNCYVSCPFGLPDNEGIPPYLSLREQDYLKGILWENKTAYHRLNQRMREIFSKLVYNDYQISRLFVCVPGDKNQ